MFEYIQIARKNKMAVTVRLIALPIMLSLVAFVWIGEKAEEILDTIYFKLPRIK